MQLVIHAPLGARINRAWGLALRKRFCRSFDFELQASADDNGIVLSLGPQHSFPLEQMFRMLNSQNGESLLIQALLAVPMFKIRWRWNITRALAVLRQNKGKKVPPHLQRFRADDLLSSVFPMASACLENVVGDIEIPDHPLVKQTVYDCLHEAMDLNRWLDILSQIERGEVELVGRDTREPSPFSHQLLNANPYAFSRSGRPWKSGGLELFSRVGRKGRMRPEICRGSIRRRLPWSWPTPGRWCAMRMNFATRC